MKKIILKYLLLLCLLTEVMIPVSISAAEEKEKVQSSGLESQTNQVLSIEWLSKTFSVPTNDLLMEMNKGYSLNEIHTALRNIQTSNQSLSEELKQINPAVDNSLQQLNYTAERFADKTDGMAPVLEEPNSVTFSTYGQFVESPNNTKVIDENLLNPSVTQNTYSTGIMSMSTSSTYPTTFDSYAVKRLGIKSDNVPYSISGDENVSLINGSLQLQSTDMVLPGRNGLSFALTRRYDSSDAFYFDKDIYSSFGYYTTYLPGLTATLNYLYGNDPVPRHIGHASEFSFFPSYSSFVQYNGDWTYWYYPNSGVRAYEFNNEVRDSLAKTWPNNPNREVLSAEFNLSGVPLFARAFTNGNVIEPPSKRESTNTLHYANTTKPRTGENRFPIGKGWSWDLPYIEGKEIGGIYKTYIHLFGGASYEISGNNVLKGYPWKDLTLRSNVTSVTVGNLKSYYLLESLDGRGHYFSMDGRLIQISDPYNNTIQFEYKDVNPYGQVLTKVKDAIGNEINISYTTTEVILTMGDRVVKYDKIKDPQGNKELLSQITDVAGRKTQYVYNIVNAPFDLIGGRMKDNFIALLKHVYHPTTARTDYSYQPITRNIGPQATETVYRVNWREELLTFTDGTEKNYNRIDYTYNGDGAAVKRSNYSFSTTINNGRTQSIYSYDKVFIDEDTPEVFYNIQITQSDNTTQKIEKMEYDRTNRRPSPIKVTSKVIRGSEVSSEKVIQRTYDEFGNVTTETDPNNIVTVYTYDNTTHLLSSISKPIKPGMSSFTEYVRYPKTNSIKLMQEKENNNTGLVKAQTQFVYDTYGNPSTITIKDDNRDISINFIYGMKHNYAFPSSQSIQVTDADNNITTIEQMFEYNLRGEMNKLIDGKGYSTQYEYDKLGRITKVINPDLSTYTLFYDDLKNQVTAIDETGVTTITKWNPLGWKISEGISIKIAREFDYDAFGRLSWSKDGGNRLTKYQYDAWDRIVRVDYPGTVSSYDTNDYDDIHRIVTSTDAEGNRLKATHDILGRVAKTEAFSSAGALQSSEQFTYDFTGNVLSHMDGKGNITSYDYDVLSRIISVTNPKLEVTQYKYTLANQLNRIIYPDKNQVVKEFDQLGRLIKQTDSAGQITKYYYDANNNVSKMIDRKGQEQIFGYNNRDFLITNAKGNETITYQYDAAGRRKLMQDGTGKTIYHYDGATGWLKGLTYPDNRTITYQYDNEGRRTQMIDPFGVVTAYGYDDRNRLAGVGPSLNDLEATYTYKKNNLLAGVSLRNGISSALGYEGFNLTRLSQSRSNGQSINTFGYQYDLNRNQTGKTENGAAYTFTYDQLNRIETSTQFNEQYTYDNRGNRLTMQSAQPIFFTESNYQYDERNRLTKVNNDGGQTVSYSYNGEGLLVERTESGVTTRFYYDGVNIIAEGTVVNGVVSHKASYIRGNQLVARVDGSGNKAYYVHNGHGDVVGLVDGSGNVINQYTYDIWGNPISQQETVPNPFRYSGEFWDDSTKLQYLRARWYDPSMGRFINEDTYEGDITNPLTLNLYTYVHNNPLRYIDSSGNWATEVTANWTINEMKWQWEKAYSSGNTNKMNYWAGEANKLRDRMRAAGYSDSDIMQSGDFSIPEAIVMEIAKASTINWIESDAFGLKLYVDAAQMIIPDPMTLGTLNGPGKMKFSFNNLPKNANDLLKNGWKDVTPEGMLKNTTSREYLDEVTGFKVRFDPGKEGANGFEGMDHYHIYNPNSTGKMDYYIDKNGNPVSKGSKPSHIVP